MKETMIETEVTYTVEHGGKFYLVEHVPARVCARCGEKTFSPEVTDQLMRFAKNEFKPRRTIQVPVFDFAGRG